MTPADLRTLAAEVLVRHRWTTKSSTDEHCAICRGRWPCPTVQLALAVERLLAVVETAEWTRGKLAALVGHTAYDRELANIAGGLAAALATLEAR